MVRVGRIKVGESEGPSAAGWKGERVKGIRVATNGRALMTVTSWLIRSQRELSGLKSVAPLLDVSQHYGVCLVPGSSCACPGYVRVSFANMQVRLAQLLCPSVGAGSVRACTSMRSPAHPCPHSALWCMPSHSPLQHSAPLLVAQLGSDLLLPLAPCNGPWLTATDANMGLLLSHAEWSVLPLIILQGERLVMAASRLKSALAHLVERGMQL